MRYFLALLFIAVCKAQECVVTEWGDWSECKHSQTRPAESYQAGPRKPTDARDRAETMQLLMARKEAAWAEHRACVKAGLCSQRQSALEPETCTDGMAGEYPCRNIDLMAHLSLDDLGYDPDRFGYLWDINPRGNDIWGWTDPQTNDEYAIIGMTGATSFVRVNDPENPVVVGILYNSEDEFGDVVDPSSWRDLKVVNDHVFIVSEARQMGMQVFDLRTMRGLGATDPVREFTATAWQRDLTGGEDIANTHNIAHNPATERVFLVGGQRGGNCLAGLKVYDVSSPNEPVFIGCYEEDGYVHDTQCVVYNGPDTRYTGREICFCFNENTLTIVDTTDPENGQELSRTFYDSSIMTYTHQGWITEDMSVLLLDDEQDEQRLQDGITYFGETITHIFDITNLEDPDLRNTYYSTETSIDHNQYVLGNMTYQANYQAGLRILHIDQANYDLTELAYFDIHTDGTEPSFNGAWSNYPYFTQGARGIVAVSSIENGLYLLRPNMQAIQRDLAAKKKVGLQRRTRSIVSSDEGRNCPALEEIRQC